MVTPSSVRPPRESLLILSDVHLGSDINDRATPGYRTRRSPRIDADLVQLFRHYARTAPPDADRWHAVIAGDFIDFIGMAVATTEELRTSLATVPSEEELAHGLGNAADHARLKFQRVAERHRDVFTAVAEFVAEGHALTFVHGNHDIELHWEAVRSEIKDTLVRLAKDAGRIIDDEVLRARVAFNPWFFYADGLAYIEHGHMYDSYCSTEYVMAPVSPFDPRRIARGFSDVFLRYVVRPTRGMREHGHDGRGMFFYIAFAMGLGVRGLVKLGVRFALAVIELFRLRRENFSDAARTLREEHERRMAMLSEATRIGLDRLKALAALQAPPITHSIRGILASVLLDRLAVAMTASMSMLVLAVVGWRHGHVWWAAGLVAVAWAFANRHLANQRKVDPDEKLVERASHLAKLFPAAFVVMGHTHVPMRVPVDGGATYINVGSWAEEEFEEDAALGDKAEHPRAARTHLVITRTEDGPVAELLAWDSSSGPQKFIRG